VVQLPGKNIFISWCSQVKKNDKNHLTESKGIIENGSRNIMAKIIGEEGTCNFDLTEEKKKRLVYIGECASWKVRCEILEWESI
jgi:hypothetical protein